ELISFSNNQSHSLVATLNQQLQQTQTQTVAVTEQSANLLVKLSDQLLLLQQHLQNNNGKLLQGKTAEVFIADQLKNVAVKLEQLLSTAQLKSDIASANPLPLVQDEHKPTGTAAGELQRLEQQSVH